MLIPDKPDSERDAVARAFVSGGGAVQRLAKFWRPPEIDPETVRVYGPDSFALVLAKVLGLRLVEPPQDLILSVPPDHLGRQVFATSLGDVEEAWFPVFVKPLVPKQFVGKVYESLGELGDGTRGLADSERILLSSIVDIVAEARFFLLNGRVLDGALYEGEAELADATQRVEQLVSVIQVPSTVVLDVGLLADGRWVFVEANASWGAGLNGCRAEKVLPAILEATKPATTAGHDGAEAGRVD